MTDLIFASCVALEKSLHSLSLLFIHLLVHFLNYFGSTFSVPVTISGTGNATVPDKPGPSYS